MFIPLLIATVVGYLLGSLPFGYLVARAYGVDIFKEGSGNPGATNVLRLGGAAATTAPTLRLSLETVPSSSLRHGQKS